MRLENVKPGAALTVEQANQLHSELDQAISVIARRRRHLLLVHDSLKSTIGTFLGMLGLTVQYEVPFAQGRWSTERVVFDIVASSGDRELVVEVKDVITSRDLGQVYGYAAALQLAGEKAQLCLGTDLLNYHDILQGMVGETLRELMEQEGVGVIPADKYLLMVCENYLQLTLAQMPLIVPSEQPVG